MAHNHDGESPEDGNQRRCRSRKSNNLRLRQRRIRYDIDQSESPSEDSSFTLGDDREDKDDANDPLPHDISKPRTRRMGVYRKKTATRGGEGGVKYTCDVCSVDITSTVSSRARLPPSNAYKSLIYSRFVSDAPMLSVPTMTSV